MRIRRGPATVTGGRHPRERHALEPLDRRRRPGKARGGRPGSQETCPDRTARYALVERGGLMHHRLAGLALAVLALLVPASVAVAAPVTVNLRIEGSAGTLFGRRSRPTRRPCQHALRRRTAPVRRRAEPQPEHGDQRGNSTTRPDRRRRAHRRHAIAQWFPSTPAGGDFCVSRSAPTSTRASRRSRRGASRLNFHALQVGGCQVPLGTGADVLWAYDFFNNPRLLQSSGPAAARRHAVHRERLRRRDRQPGRRRERRRRDHRRERPRDGDDRPGRGAAPQGERPVVDRVRTRSSSPRASRRRASPAPSSITPPPARASSRPAAATSTASRSSPRGSSTSPWPRAGRACAP